MLKRKGEEDYYQSSKRLRLPPKITNLQELISFSESTKKYHTINMKALRNIRNDLIKLNNMVGMESLKNSLLYQILYYLQGFNNDDYLNTVIYGPPGSGKTTVARIIGNIYKNLDLFNLNEPLKFIIAKRDDFIGKYVGHTAIKTRNLLESAKGGILFIDEAYSMGSGKEDSDSFSKEAIEVLNEFMSENKRNFCCIIAGYEHMVKKCFFSVNPGLERRFAWIHTIDKYDYSHLTDIFLSMIDKIGWVSSVPKERINEIFKENSEIFKFDGGSVELFLVKCKMSHSQRVFNQHILTKYILIEEDILQGVSLMKKNSDIQKEDKRYLDLYL